MTTSKKHTRANRTSQTADVIVHRGVKIVPIAGKRSVTGQALRDALKRQVGQPRGKFAKA